MGKKQRKIGREDVVRYLKSRKNAFFRMVIFALFAVLFYSIGKIWRESYYVTLMFFYPISIGAAFFQLFYFLPKRSFLRSKLEKIWQRVETRLLDVVNSLGDAMKGLGESFRTRKHRKKVVKPAKKKNKNKNGAYRDEFLYAEGNGLFGHRRRHLRWRDMKSNQDKIRFYYMRYVLGTVKKGAPFSYHLTPGELKALWKNPENAEPLTGLYYRARYGGQEINEEELAGVQREE